MTNDLPGGEGVTNHNNGTSLFEKNIILFFSDKDAIKCHSIPFYRPCLFLDPITTTTEIITHEFLSTHINKNQV